VTVHLTAKEAAALGIDPAKGRHVAERKPGSRALPRGYHTLCTTCRVEFTSQASEDRHLAETKHRRYELIIERSAP